MTRCEQWRQVVHERMVCAPVLTLSALLMLGPLEDLESRFELTEKVVLKLKEGTDIVRSSVGDRR